MILYKVLDEEGCSCNGGITNWNLPKKRDNGEWKPGKWMPVIKGALVPCENGYHLCRPQDVVEWLGSTIYHAEYDGEIVEDIEKIVVRKTRLLKRCGNWTEESARLFACWCVRHTPLADGRTVWDLIPDERSKKAVEVLERNARGGATEEDVRVAQGAARAAWAAARDTEGDARDAAWAAAWAAGSAAGWAAAGDARDAARDARGAAWAAAWAAATWAAAWAAARDTEGDARDAARDTEGDARDAAWAAARDAQTKELLRILEAEELADK